MTINKPLLQISGCSVCYSSKRHEPFFAVRDAELSIDEGEVLGLVGESGCGKTTLTRAILALTPVCAGSIRLADYTIVPGGHGDLSNYRRSIGVVFQNPYSSLNPRMTVYDILAEPLRVLKIGNRTAQSAMVEQMIDEVGLEQRHLVRYPHEFSGGQRQRIAIGRALIARPRLLLADEPVSALDVSVQAQIINLLQRIVRQHGLSMLFISHDMSVVRHCARRIAVMHRGRIVETAPAEQILSAPHNEYTQSLVAAIAVADPALMRKRYETIAALEAHQ